MTGARSRRPGVPLLLAGIALAVFLLPGILGPYTYFIDELYYLSCSKRLAWGYVDHPPLAPFLLRVARTFLGDGLLALRLPASLAGASVVGLAALLARRLGGGTYAQVLAGAAIILSPLMLVMCGFFSMNAFEILLWSVCGWILIEIEEREEPRLWLLFGLVSGIGLLNKHTFVLLGVALAAGMILTPARCHLASRWLWAGLGLAALIFLPNLLWQAANGWPSLEFYRNAALYKNVRVPPWEVLSQQVLFVGPGALPIWAAGLFCLWRWRGGKTLRHVAILYLALLAMAMAGGQSRPDRIAGFYPVLLAAGGVQIERWTQGVRRRAWRLAAPAALALFSLVLLPIGSPILPPETAARYAGALGVVPQIEQGEGKRTMLPQWFADRLGWERFVDDVAAVREELAPEERERAVYFAPSYGQAGALEWLGRDRGLGNVYTTHNTWFLWGPPADPVDVAIVMGNDAEGLGELWEEVRLAGVHDCDYCMPWRDRMPIWIVRRARRPIGPLWEGWRHYE